MSRNRAGSGAGPGSIVTPPDHDGGMLDVEVSGVSEVEQAIGQLVRAMDAEILCGLGLEDLDGRMRACQQVSSAVAAYQARVFTPHEAAMAQRGLRGSGAAHLTVTLGVSAREARVRVAETLAELVPAGEALAAGEITSGHAEVLATRLRPRHRATASTDRWLIASAKHQSVDAFRRVVDDFVRRCDRDVDGVEVALVQHGRRRASVSTCADGMVRLEALLPPDTGAVVKGVVEAIADDLWRNEDCRSSGSGGSRTVEQRMADAVVDMARGFGRGAAGGRARPEVIVTVDHRWLTGQVEELFADPGAGAGPLLPRCEIPGVGPNAPATARRLACDAGIIPMVLGGDSQPLDMGRRRYRITPAQRRALIVRDGGCVWPGCDRPPSWCEAHHLDEWIRDDGPTDLDNLALLCSRNHHDVHEGGRSLDQDEQDTWQIRLGLPPPRASAA